MPNATVDFFVSYTSADGRVAGIVDAASEKRSDRAEVDIQTDAGSTYSVLCDQMHWTLALNAGDPPTAVIIDATAMDGTLIVREDCILASDDRYQPTCHPWRLCGARGSRRTMGWQRPGCGGGRWTGPLDNRPPPNASRGEF